MIGNKNQYAKGGEIASAIFNSNSKKGKISTSFGDKTKEGLTAMIENDSYSAKEIANAIFEFNEKRDKVKTNYGDKTKEGLISMIESARDSYAKGGKVFKAPKGWRKTRQDEGEKTYKHKDGREIIVSESWTGTPSFEVKWELEKSYNWEDWKRKKFPMTKEGTKEMEEFLTKLMSSSYAKGGKTDTRNILMRGKKVRIINTRNHNKEGYLVSNKLPNGKFKVILENGKLTSTSSDNIMLIDEKIYFAKGGDIIKDKDKQGNDGYKVFAVVDNFDYENQDYDQLYYKTDDEEEITDILEEYKKFGDYVEGMEVIEVMSDGRMIKYRTSIDYSDQVGKFAKGGKTDDVIMIEIGGDKKYPYYIKKIDTTHIAMANNKDGVDLGVTSHILQHKGESYYDDVRSWLKGGTSPNGKSYDSDYYAKGGEISLDKNLKNYIDTLGKEDLISMRNELGSELDKGLLDKNKYKDELSYLNNRIGKYMYAKGGKAPDDYTGGSRVLGYVAVLRDMKSSYYKDMPKKGDILPFTKENCDRYDVCHSVTAWYKGRGNEYSLQDEMRGFYDGEVEYTGRYFAKGGEVKKKENNEMIMGGLAGILLGIFLNK